MIFKALHIMTTLILCICKSNETTIPVKSFNLTSQDGHDSPTLIQQKMKMEKVAAPKCTDFDFKTNREQSSELHSNSVKGWTIFLYVCLGLILVAIVAALLYKQFRDNSPNIFEKIYPGIRVQESDKPINSGRNTIIQV